MKIEVIWKLIDHNSSRILPVYLVRDCCILRKSIQVDSMDRMCQTIYIYIYAHIIIIHACVYMYIYKYIYVAAISVSGTSVNLLQRTIRHGCRPIPRNSEAHVQYLPRKETADWFHVLLGLNSTSNSIETVLANAATILAAGNTPGLVWKGCSQCPGLIIMLSLKA